MNRCITQNQYEYLQLISKYWKKNKICIKKGIKNGGADKGALTHAVLCECDLKWFELIFDLCGKVNTAPSKEDFEYAFKVDKFEKLSNECQSIVNENYAKFYPKIEKSKKID